MTKSNSRLNMGKACYLPVQSLLFSRPLPKILNFIIYRSKILPATLCGCETYLSLLRKHRLRVTEKIMLRIFGPKKEVTAGCKNEMRNFIISTVH
jgi:hypothetical protein